MCYTNQDRLKYELQKRYEGKVPYDSRKEFPDTGIDYVKRFHQVEEKLNSEWHPDVTLGAAISGDGLLTDHGVKHVQSVIQHAGMIIRDLDRLTGYEIYILLLAIHFHDLGNIYGRDEHEKKIAEVILSLDKELQLATQEKQFINDIATAHGGSNEGDKDTIGRIGPDTMFGGVRVRQKVLAAILRFADEISDDLNRSNFKGIIPTENQVFHEYSKSLQPISIDGETIIMKYQIPYNLAINKVGKGNTKVYLYDEIQSRLGKCMRELEYCRKYAEGQLIPSTVSVGIRILKKDDFREIEDLKDDFRLTLHGYPDMRIFTFEYYLELDPTTGHSIHLKYNNGKALHNTVLRRPK